MNKNKLGVSAYISNVDNLDYLKKAACDGIRNIFISLHIPEEVAKPTFKNDVLNLLRIVKDLEFTNVLCDISPSGLAALNISIGDVSLLKYLGVTTLRLDYGFTFDQTIKLARQINIAINASQVTHDELEKYKNENIINSVVASHNFYPLIGSGISESDMLSKDSLLRMYGIDEIYSFIPGKNNFRKTSEIAYGLPTLESHRLLDRTVAFEFLSDTCNHNIVYIGDNDFFELTRTDFTKVNATFTDRKFLLGMNKFSTRLSENFIRLKGTRINQNSESGQLVNEGISEIIPIKNFGLEMGDIVVINNNSSRYLGEVLIAKKPLSTDYSSIFNIIGKCNLSAENIIEIDKKQTIEFV